MAASLDVRGYKPADEKFKKMKDVWDSCIELKISIPKEVDDFFNGESPDAAGVLVERKQLEACGCVTKYRGDGEHGYDIDVSKIPKDVKILRFTLG